MTHAYHQQSTLMAKHLRSHTTSATLVPASTTTPSLNVEINKHITKAFVMMSKLSRRVWYYKQVTLKTKLKVYQIFVFINLLDGSGSWTTYPRQKNCMESFHIRKLRQIFSIT